MNVGQFYKGSMKQNQHLRLPVGGALNFMTVLPGSATRLALSPQLWPGIMVL